MNLDDDSSELSRELHARSREVGGHPVDFASVRRSARRIQLRRRIAAGGAGVAVLALAVPAGMAASHSIDLGQQPAGQPTVTAPATTTQLATPTTAELSPPSTDRPTTASTTTLPTVTHTTVTPTDTTTASTTLSEPSPTPTSVNGRTVDLTAVGAVRGADPAIGYTDHRTLQLPDGDSVALAGNYFAIAPHRDGWIALGSNDSGRVTLYFLAADGTVQSSQPSPAYDFAVSNDGDWVLYAGAENGVLKLAPTSGQLDTYTFHITTPGYISPVAVGTIVQDPVEDRGVIFYNTDGREQRAWYADLHGIVDVVAPFKRLSGYAPDGSQSGIVSTSDTGSCSQVRNEDRSKRWETCDYGLGRFSSDSRYVLGNEAYQDGIGSSQVTILDAQTGEVVVSYQRPESTGLFVADAKWEDSSHVLAIVYEADAWRILRLGVDGTVEQASAAIKAPNDSRPFYFTAQP